MDERDILGMILIRTLAKQTDATPEVVNNGGTDVRMALRSQNEVLQEAETRRYLIES